MKKFLCAVALSLPLVSMGQVPVKAEDISPLLVGETMPDVKVESVEHGTIHTSSLWKEKKTVLIFYRGGWCPYCNLHLGEIAEIEPELRLLGYQVIGVGTDDVETIQKHLKKNNVTYHLISDSSAEFAKACGLAFRAPKHYDKILAESAHGKNTELLLPVPSVFIVNEKGEIEFEYINPNFKKRISGSLLLAAAKIYSAQK